MRVLVAMSGGVDSSVAAALVLEEGHDVVGATMKLWGGPGDRGCCSVADVDDARRVAQQLGIDHHVFNFSEEFERKVVGPYVGDHADGRTPNPCIECNRHMKFDRLLDRAVRLGFDAVATGHHARVVQGDDGAWSLLRGADGSKDQSYVLHMLGQAQLRRVMLPIGAMTKAEVRETAAGLGLRTAGKADSQDVCFIPGRDARGWFLEQRIGLHAGRLIDEEGRELGTVPAVELVTIGQRRGLGARIGTRYVTAVDPVAGTVRVGPAAELVVTETPVAGITWVDRPPRDAEALSVQVSAHGQPVRASWDAVRQIVCHDPIRRVAPGQSVVLYRGEAVVGGGVATTPDSSHPVGTVGA